MAHLTKACRRTVTPVCYECGADRLAIINPDVLAEFGPDAHCCEVSLDG